MGISFRKNIFISLTILGFSLLVSSYIVLTPGEDVFAQRFTEERHLPPQLDFVSQWNGGEVSGKTATDIGSGNNGTLLGGTTVASGRFGKAFKFNGSDAYVKMGNPASLNFGTGPFSLDARFRLDGVTSSIGNIIRKSNYPESGKGAGYWLRIGMSEGKSVLEFSVGATTGPEGQSLVTAPISFGVWHYVVATRDSSGAVKLYVDGQSKGTVLRRAAKAETTSEAPFTLGAWDDRFGVREFFSGSIEEVSVYSRALTAREVQSGYKELRQILAAKDSGVHFPGNCDTRYKCLKYCEAPTHALECVDFAEAAGFISKDEAAQARKFIPLIQQGVTPGKCDTKEGCDAYCAQKTHALECMEFAVKYEILPPDELEIVKKILPFMRAGKMPGNCSTKDECEAYCTAEGHFEECLELGLAIGVIDPSEVDLIRKSGGKGPGGCRSKDACEAFCQKPENQKECRDFAVKIGLMTQEEADQAEAAGDVRQCFEEADEKIISCFVTNLGTDVFEQMRAGKMPYDIAILEKMRKATACVKQYANQATDQLDVFLKALPAADSCITTEFGPDFIGRLKRMTIPCSQMKGVKGKLEACFLKGTNALFEPCAQKECNQVQSCMVEAAKPLMSLAKRVEASDPTKAQKRELPKVITDKLNSCGIDPNFEPNACITKPSCTEFFSCLNPSGSQQPQGEPPGDFEMPPDFKNRMDSCRKELIDSQMRECTNKPTCSEVNACLKSKQQGAGDRKDKGEKIELPLDVESRLMSCMKEEIQAKLDACLNLSCSEFDSCLKSLTQGAGDKGGQQQGQGQQTEDPKMKAKIQACSDEKINVCLSKPCGEFQACINALGQGGGDKGGKQQQGQSNPAIEAKFKSCQPKGGGGAPPGGGGFPGGGGQPPSGGFQPPSGGGFTPPPGGFAPPSGGFPSPTQLPPGGSSSEIPITPELCANFSSTPSCSFIGPPDSQNYQLCKKCYPDRAGIPPATPPSSQAPAASLFGLLIAPFLELFR